MSSEAVVLVPEWVADLAQSGLFAEEGSIDYWHNRVLPVHLTFVNADGVVSECEYWYTPEELEATIARYALLPQRGLLWQSGDTLHEVMLPYVEKL